MSFTAAFTSVIAIIWSGKIQIQSVVRQWISTQCLARNQYLSISKYGCTVVICLQHFRCSWCEVDVDVLQRQQSTERDWVSGWSTLVWSLKPFISGLSFSLMLSDGRPYVVLMWCLFYSYPLDVQAHWAAPARSISDVGWTFCLLPSLNYMGVKKCKIWTHFSHCRFCVVLNCNSLWDCLLYTSDAADE